MPSALSFGVIPAFNPYFKICIGRVQWLHFLHTAQIILLFMLIALFVHTHAYSEIFHNLDTILFNMDYSKKVGSLNQFL